MSGSDESKSWSAHRAEVVEAQERARADEREAEHRRATEKILAAIERFRRDGIDPIPLRAHTYSGTGSIRTSLHGWYLKKDRTVAIDTEGHYYVMRVDGGLLARLRGADPFPRQAPLVVGRGARDGETFDLDELLEMRRKDPVES